MKENFEHLGYHQNGTIRARVKCACGHYEIVYLPLDAEKRAKRLQVIQNQWKCDACIAAEVEDSLHPGLIPVKMPVRMKKAYFPDADSRMLSYDRKTDTIIVYLPQRHIDKLREHFPSKIIEKKAG